MVVAMTTEQPLERYMARAIELARQAVGAVSPNPPAGAVVVRDGHIVGEGHTQPPGQAHAEIMALGDAGEATRGAELYVTLEPCAHQGRTGPCTAAIIGAGIRRVHIAALDPNPLTDGRGVHTLERGGISVLLREGNLEALELVEAFTKHVTTGLPFVVAKFAASLDGKIATRSGDSKWISSPGSRAYAHALRASVDAVMVGIGTAIADDPRLTVRDASLSGDQPTRVVVDTHARLPLTTMMLGEPGTTIVATAGAPPERMRALEAAGAVVIDAAAGTAVDLAMLLTALGDRDITSVLVEGGSRLFGSLFDAGLIDKVVGIVAPVIIGGADAPGPVGGHGAQTMPDALTLSRVTHREIDGDIVFVGYPEPTPPRSRRKKGG